MLNVPSLGPSLSPGAVYVSTRTTNTHPTKLTRKPPSALLQQLRAIVEPPREQHRLLTNTGSIHDNHGENELFWTHSTVTWSVGGVQKRRWSFALDKQTVTCACFAWLDGSKMTESDDPLPPEGDVHVDRLSRSEDMPFAATLVQDQVDERRKTFGPFSHLRQTPHSQAKASVDHTRAICIFLQGVAHFYSIPSGLEWTVNIPFVVHRVWEILPVGILLQASLTAQDEAEVLRRGQPMMPSLYSLTSAYDEVRAVVFASEIMGGLDASCPPGQSLPPPLPQVTRDPSRVPLVKWYDRVLYVSPTSPTSPITSHRYILTMDPRAQKLKILRYVYIPRDDRPSPLRLPSPNTWQLSSDIAMADPLGSIQDEKISHNRELEEMLKAAEPAAARHSLTITTPKQQLAPFKIDDFKGAPDPVETPTPSHGSVDGPNSRRNVPLMTFAEAEETIYPNNKKIKGEIFVECLLELDIGKEDVLHSDEIAAATFDHRMDRIGFAVLLSSPVPSLNLFSISPNQGRQQLLAVLQQIIPTVSFAAVHAIRYNGPSEELKDLLVLSEDGSLRLISPLGDISVTVERFPTDGPASGSVDVPTASLMVSPIRPSATTSGASSRKAVKLFDAVGSFVSISYSDGTSARVSTDLHPHSPFVQDAFAVLSRVASDKVSWAIRKGYLLRWQERYHRAGDVKEEWSCFEESLLDVLRREEDGDDMDVDADSVMLSRPPSSLRSQSSSPGKRSRGGGGGAMMPPDSWTSLSSHAAHLRLANDTALRYLDLPSPLPSRSTLPLPSRCLHRETPAILHGLHLLGEEYKVDAMRRADLLLLVPLLLTLAKSVGADWADHWLRLFPEIDQRWDIGDSVSLGNVPAPPSLVAHLYGMLSASPTELQSYPGIRFLVNHYSAVPSLELGFVNPYPLTTKLMNIYAALRSSPWKITIPIDSADPAMSQPIVEGSAQPETTHRRAINAVLVMLRHNMTLEDIENLPFGIAAPVREALRTVQNQPPGGWSREGYMLVGRNDIAKMVAGSHSHVGGRADASVWKLPPTHRDLEDESYSESISSIASQARVFTSTIHEVNPGIDPSGTTFDSLRFAEDQRLKEVEIVLSSSRVQTVKIPEAPNLNEHELAKELVATVQHIIERTFSQPFGRALYTYATVPELTQDKFVVAPLEMRVKFIPYNVTYAPDNAKISVEARQWAEFHNGIADALQLHPSASGVSTHWIALNKPGELNAEHAGYLLGLGLNGHLRNVSHWHTYRYLSTKHESTAAGVLLGMSAAHVGTGDPETTRTLTIHMRPLLPAGAAELGVPLGAQSAALMGLGLLYLGTTNRHIANVALNELASSHQIHGPEIPNEHKEAYTITAALAFGMIMCGSGNRANNPSDLDIITKLRAYIAGKQPPAELTKTQIRPEEMTGEINLNFINPAATIALALMFLRTNRADIAAVFAIPHDPTGLQNIQPSLLLLRTLGRSLIMWDEITPNVRWVLDLAQKAPKSMGKRAVPSAIRDLYETAFFNIMAGACLAIGLKYAGTANTAANQVLTHFHDKLLENLGMHAHSPQGFETNLRRSAIREAMNVVDLALGMVMAGTGDVGCMQRFRLRHGLFGPQFKYGSHIATHMAMGFLFLGGGRYTLGTSNAAIACLVTTVYPRFPLHTNDTRGLLQAFRHLWVLAVEPRCLIARDADTNEIARIPIKIKIAEDNPSPSVPLQTGEETHDGGKTIIRTHPYVCPTLLPDFDHFVSLRVDSPRYWPFNLHLEGDSLHKLALLRNQTIYVKRRTGYLSYLNDPQGFQSLSLWNGSPIGEPSILDFPASANRMTDAVEEGKNLPRPFQDMRHLSSHSTHDERLLAFADRFCRTPGLNADEVRMTSFTQQAFLECLSGDKPAILSSFLAFYIARESLNVAPTFSTPPSAPSTTPDYDRLEIVKSGVALLDVEQTHFATDFYNALFRQYGGHVEHAQRQPLMRIAALQGTTANHGQAVDALRRDAAFMAIYRSYARGEPLDFGSTSDEDTLFNKPTRTDEEEEDERRRRRSLVRDLAFFLTHERVPSSSVLSVMRNLAMPHFHVLATPRRARARAADHANAERLRTNLVLLMQSTALTFKAPRTLSWTLRSISEILDFWVTD